MFIRQASEEPVNWDFERDILIVGAGGCGLTAAVTAAERAPELEITVLEKNPAVGGKTKLSSGMIRAAGTKLQKAEGIDDSPESLTDDILAVREDENKSRDRAVISAIAAESGPTIDWLADSIGVDFHLHTGPYGLSENSVYRNHYPVNEVGEVPRNCVTVIDGLESKAASLGVEVLTSTPAHQLVVDGDEVIGVVSKQEPQAEPRMQSRSTFKSKKVLLANDGFGANVDMRNEFFPEIRGLEHWGSHGNTGEAVKWGQALGAQMEEPHYNVISLFTDPDQVWLPVELTREEGAIYVNREGERFVDVSNEIYITISTEVLKQPGKVAYVLFDQNIRDSLRSVKITKNEIENAFDQDVFAESETVEGLATQLGVEPSTLEETVTNVNEAAQSSGGESTGGDEKRVKQTLSPPFYGTRVKPVLIKCKMGLRVNEQAEVLHEDGHSIPNLYAGGNAAMALSGGDELSLTPGTNLMTAFTQGRIMGKSAADSLS